MKNTDSKTETFFSQDPLSCPQQEVFSQSRPQSPLPSHPEDPLQPQAKNPLPAQAKKAAASRWIFSVAHPQPVCRVVGAGEGFPDFVPLRPAPGDLLVAADGGAAALRSRGLTPQVLLGDFDSLGYRPAGDNVYPFPVMKDDTDMMLALRLGLQRGYRLFYLYGGTGGRLDHTLANLQALQFLARQGAVGFLFAPGYTLTAVQDGGVYFPPGAEGLLSVFAAGGEAVGVSLRGLLYPLHDARLVPSVPLGVSNHFTAARAAVRVRQGTLLLCWQAPCLPAVRPGAPAVSRE